MFSGCSIVGNVVAVATL